MVKIRLQRTGRKKRPSYRIIVVDSNKKRSSQYIEKLGHYNPSENTTLVIYNKESYQKWIGVGAQPTQAVVDLISGKYTFKKYPVEKVEEVTTSEADATAAATK